MKPDLYAKTVLTVIAIMLTAIAVNLYVNPKTAVQAQAAPFNGVLYAYANTYSSFFDPRTGNIWVYDDQTQKVILQRKLVTLGQPLQ